MALNTALYTRMHNKTGSDLAAMETAFDNDEQINLIDFLVSQPCSIKYKKCKRS